MSHTTVEERRDENELSLQRERALNRSLHNKRIELFQSKSPAVKEVIRAVQRISPGWGHKCKNSIPVELFTLIYD